ncbi:MAG: DUF167 domain-containing protein [Thermoplasmata archaeon]
MTRIPVWVKAGSPSDSLGWDAWRQRWVVACREPPVSGRANRAVAGLVAGWLAVPPSSVRWEQAGTSRAKLLVVEGLEDREVEARLRAQVATRKRNSE